jgi:hypothetical protein
MNTIQKIGCLLILPLAGFCIVGVGRLLWVAFQQEPWITLFAICYLVGMFLLLFAKDTQ